MYYYLRDLNVIEFINITSLRINNKKYFNFIDEKSAPIGADFSVIQNNLLDEDMNHYDLEKLLNTCIIKPYENCDNTKYRETTENTYNSIKEDIKEVHSTLNRIESRIDSRSNNNYKDIEENIINYIKNNSKWTKKYIIEELDPKHNIVKTNWTKFNIIRWYNSKITS